MEHQAQFRLARAQEQIRRRIQEAEQERLAPVRPSQSIRQSVGFSIIRIGERLAAERSPLRPAQLR